MNDNCIYKAEIDVWINVCILYSNSDAWKLSAIFVVTSDFSETEIWFPESFDTTFGHNLNFYFMRKMHA